MSPSGPIAAAAPGDSGMSCFAAGKNGPSGGATGSSEADSGSSTANRWSISISVAPEVWANTKALPNTRIAGCVSEDIVHRIVPRPPRQVSCLQRASWAADVQFPASPFFAPECIQLFRREVRNRPAIFGGLSRERGNLAMNRLGISTFILVKLVRLLPGQLNLPFHYPEQSPPDLGDLIG